MPINLNEGFLVTASGIFIGAYNTFKKVYVLKEGFTTNNIILPDSLEPFSFVAKAGHFTVGYWSFDEDKEVFL